MDTRLSGRTLENRQSSTLRKTVKRPSAHTQGFAKVNQQRIPEVSSTWTRFWGNCLFADLTMALYGQLVGGGCLKLQKQIGLPSSSTVYCHSQVKGEPSSHATSSSAQHMKIVRQSHTSYCPTVQICQYYCYISLAQNQDTTLVIDVPFSQQAIVNQKP